MQTNTFRQSNEKDASKCVNIKVSRDVALLLKTYCVINNRQMSDFTTEVLKEKLSEFNERLKRLREAR
ncbi:hypothetical protein J4219_05600 [Candidatus Woesearchaeota archaeon]|nr:hypothetical protein [Candidatus Woesearchaeota archaeon]